jgi:hypothetical protein
LTSTTLGVIGEYLGRVFNETKHRPLYVLERYEPSRSHISFDQEKERAEL